VECLVCAAKVSAMGLALRLDKNSAWQTWWSSGGNSGGGAWPAKDKACRSCGKKFWREWDRHQHERMCQSYTHARSRAPRPPDKRNKKAQSMRVEGYGYGYRGQEALQVLLQDPPPERPWGGREAPQASQSASSVETTSTAVSASRLPALAEFRAAAAEALQARI
ncbi:unnamed protein product, partial [Symbiodinium pilosum]